MEFSNNLKKAIQYFADKQEMNMEDKKMFLDILKFAYKEGSIQGKTDMYKEFPNRKGEN